MKIFLYSLLAMTAVAGNSFFTRLALSSTDIDHSTFSLVRIFSACLIVLMVVPQNKETSPPSRPITILLSTLFVVYVFTFSYAYTWLSISIGGLLLFTVMQICSILSSVIYSREILNPIQLLGFLITFIGGLSLFTNPVSLNTSITSLCLITLAGIAWSGFSFTIQYKCFSVFNLRDVFKLTLALTSLPLALNLIAFGTRVSLDGYVYALLCGALTTGLGYSLWLLIANQLTSLSANTAQLLAPLITIMLGLSFLTETFTTYQSSSFVLIFVGTGIFFLSRYLQSLESAK